MAPVTVGIAGFTGRVATLLASSLLEQDPNVHIKGLARVPDNVAKSISSKSNVQVFQGGAFDPDQIRSFVRGCDVVVCCYSHDDRIMVDGQKLLIDLAEEEGVPRYVASDWCLDYTKLEMGELFAKEASQRIKVYLDSRNSIKGVHMLIGGFAEVIFAAFFRIWDWQTSTLRYWGTGDEIWECTTYRDSAQYTAAVCLDRNAVGVFRFVGDVISTKAIAAALEKVYGVKPKLEYQGSIDELRSTMITEKEKHGDDYWNYVFHWYHYFTLSGKALMGPKYDNDEYPQVKPVKVDEFLKTVPLEQLNGVYMAMDDKIKKS
ncbi:hypothetical protein PV08_04701 [Exophiala spinifera]|uniref:NAD(P)-binding domain-containing protein n=1 Tax=Exophiala spinifera TaxID=91928 RepID=A0A0D1ZY26_9EURO|nr:uncharacterized protein PV08_04701 [Exophiala spinifera]KIW17507.1 hypothetical protein PV08_04701 [Exophiala spinifera]